jgi:hypothetical protein
MLRRKSIVDPKTEIERLKRNTDGVLKEVTKETEKALRFSTCIKFRNGNTADIWLPKSVFKDGEITESGLRILAGKVKELEDFYGAEVVR